MFFHFEIVKIIISLSLINPSVNQTQIVDFGKKDKIEKSEIYTINHKKEKQNSVVKFKLSSPYKYKQNIFFISSLKDFEYLNKSDNDVEDLSIKPYEENNKNSDNIFKYVYDIGKPEINSSKLVIYTVFGSDYRSFVLYSNYFF